MNEKNTSDAIVSPGTGSRPSDGKKKKLYLVIAGIVVAAAILAAVLFAMLGPVKESARAQIDMLRAGKVTEFYQTSAASLKNQFSPEAFSAVIDRMQLSRIKDYSFNHIAVKNNHAMLEGYVVTDSGEERELEVMMKKENDVWKLVSITFPD